MYRVLEATLPSLCHVKQYVLLLLPLLLARLYIVQGAKVVTVAGVCRHLSLSVILHGGPADNFTRAGHAMTLCCLQSNYSSTVTKHVGPVVLRPVRAIPCLTKKWETLSVFRPHCTHAVHGCSLLLQTSHVAWSVCLSVGNTSELWKKQLNQSRRCLEETHVGPDCTIRYDTTWHRQTDKQTDKRT